MAPVSLSGLGKSFGPVDVVKDIDLEITDNEFLVLVGPSGCGKSTTLRMVAGLESISRGELRIDGKLANTLSPGDRDIAMVFQNYALYPHMNVAQNIAFGLRHRNLSRAQIKSAVRDAAQLLDIEPLLERRPKALSGGQRQRVAMGRAIVRNPKVFLFDEPLSNLDAKLRAQMRIEIKRLHQRVPTTTIYVTHDQVEAMTMADRVVVMNKGAIEQVGTPMDLYNAPKTRFVAEFIGSPSMNFFDGRLEATGDKLVFRFGPDLVLPIAPGQHAAYAPYVGRPMTIGLRPEALSLASETSATAANVSVKVVEPLGVETLVYFDLAGQPACARLAPTLAPRAGDTITLEFDAAQMHLIDTATGAVISRQ